MYRARAWPNLEFQGGHILKFCVLASSSSGNCAFIGSDRTRILVDAGLSRKETFTRLQAIGESPEDIDAILITHEHSDHVAGLVTVARKLKDGNVPIFASRLTAPTLDWGEFQPTVDHFQAGSRFSIGDIDIDSFTIPHDATDPCGFCFRSQGIKIALATDLGYMPDSVKVHLRGADLLMLESNHDVDMLKVGPYPWSVKQRVMGRNGHLSNDVVREYLKKDLDSSVTTVVLGHLSEHNNHPAIVRLTADQALDGRRLFTRLVIAEPRKQTEVFQY